MQKAFAVLSVAFLLFATPAFADIQITNRASHLTTTVDFGYVGNVATTTDSFTYSTIDDTQLLRQGGATDGGPLGDISWDATYQYSVDQQLIPDGTQGFNGGGSVNLFTGIGGDGVSYVATTNFLEVEFENTALTTFDLSLIATPLSRIDLDRLVSPGVWENLLSNPGGFDELTATLALESGVYRLTAQTAADTYNGGSNGGSWSFSVVAVPEPSSMALLAISGALALIGARRKSR